MEQTVTRDEIVAYIDRVIGGAKRRVGSLTSLQELNGDMIRLVILMKFDDTGLTSLCGTHFFRK